MKSLFIFFLCLGHAIAQVPNNSTQAIVGVTNGWNSSYVTLRIYQKTNSQWQPLGMPWKGRVGSKGLAWGKGLHSNPAGQAPLKREGDKRSPTGIFKIGSAYGYDAKIKKHPALSYHQVSPLDLWVEDSASPHYNKHLILDHPPKTAWEKKAQMRQGDYAHSLKLYIGHNDAVLGGTPISGLGSSIFFHVWRDGGSKATAGCTTMEKGKLKALISQIDPRQNPVYILLPQVEYEAFRSDWKLP